jgi:hypothetical protein
MSKVDQEKYELIYSHVYSVVFESLSKVGTSMTELKALSRKAVKELTEYDDYHVGRWVGRAVTDQIHSDMARLGCTATGDILVFTRQP